MTDNIRIPLHLKEQLDSAGLHAGGLFDALNISIHDASANEIVGSIPVAGNTQPAGLLHGGASIALAETLASIGAALYAAPQKSAVGTEVSASHLLPIHKGNAIGRATALYLGRSRAVYKVEVSDDAGRICSVINVSCAIVP
jgi:conserved domain protein